MSSKSISIETPTKPVVGDAPRIRRTGNNTTFDFKSVRSLVRCFESGECVPSTYKTSFKVVDKETGEKRPASRYYPKVAFGDQGVKDLCVALTRDTMSKTTGGVGKKQIKSRLLYPLLADYEENYEMLQSIWDTTDDFKSITNAFLPIAKKISDENYPGLTLRPFYPDKLTLEELASYQVENYNKGKPTTTEDRKFCIEKHLARDGKVLIKASNLWLMPDRHGQVEWGIKWVLIREKYLPEPINSVEEVVSKKRTVNDTSTVEEVSNKKRAVNDTFDPFANSN